MANPMKPPPFQYASVPKLLPTGGTVLVMGSGPSLTQADVEYARARVDLTIAINDAYLMAPNAECLWAADDKWLVKWHHGCVAPHVHHQKNYPAFTGAYKFCLSKTPYADVRTIHRGTREGLSLDPAKVALGYNGGHQSINAAVLMGADRVILLGLDMKGGKIFRDGAWRDSDHFWGRHADDTKPPYVICLSLMATMVAPLKKAGVTVINCTPDSALKCFPMQTLREALPNRAEAIAV